MDRLIVIIAAAAVASVAAAPVAAAPRPGNMEKGDPNERVCQTVEQLGTRLVAKRVCMTRAQWATQRRDDRELLDKSQMMPCVANGSTCK